MKAKIIQLGMIGCGRRSPAYASSVGAVPECRMMALCDKVAPLVKRTKAMFHDPSIREYTDHRALLADPEIDAVIVCAEPQYLAGLACEAMEAGKHVFSEVPAAFGSLEQCWRLVLTAERTDRIYYLGEQIRHSAVMRYWRKLVREGTLGTILFIEGHYMHPMGADRFWRNPDTGELLTWEQARSANRKVKTRTWANINPIWYGPHEMSPLLKVIDDRVINVSCIETGRPSKRFHEVPFPGMDMEVPIPDLQVALMQTARGAIMRFAAGFQAPISETHWYHLFGTKGEVETRRGAGEPGYFYTYPGPVTADNMDYHRPRRAEPWFHYGSVPPPEIAAQLNESLPAAIRSTGHQGMDGLPVFDFVRCLREGKEPDIDVYQAVETAAPCIVAAYSVEQGGARLEVPDFRPGPDRARGQNPKGVDERKRKGKINMAIRDPDQLRARAPLLVYRLFGLEPELLPPVEDESSVKNASLPEDLFVEPGFYSVHDGVYDLRREGLYRLLRPMHGNRQRIVFREDLEALLSAVGWMHSHGSRDDSKSYEAIRALAAYGKIVMTCGPYCGFVNRLLDECGIVSRVVNAQQLAACNGFDSGHVLLEVWWNGRWVLFDADQHGFFRGDGQRLSLLETALRIPAGTWEFERAAASIPLAVSDFYGTTSLDEGYDYGLKMEVGFYSPAAARRWHTRIMHIPVIRAGGAAWCTGLESEREAIEKFWPALRCLAIDEFRRRFYPEKKIS